MRNKLVLAIITTVLITFVIIQSCRKNDQRAASSKSVEGSFSTKKARTWWFKTFVKSAEYSKMDWTSPLAPPTGSSTKKYPRWNQAISYSIGKLQVVEMPLSYVTNSILLPGMQNLQNTAEGMRVAKSAIHKLMLFKKANGSISVRTVTIIPSAEYAKKMNYDISHISPRKLPSDFSGYQFIGGWDESQQNVIRYEAGKVARFVKLRTSKKLGASLSQQARTACGDWEWVPELVWVCVMIPTGDDAADEEACQETGSWVDSGRGSWEWIEFPCEDEEPDPYEDCLNNHTSEECDCLIYNVCDDGGTGDNGGGDPVSDPPPVIVNEITNPCLNTALGKLNAGTQSTFFKDIYNIFDNSSDLHIFLSEGDLTSSSAYGTAGPVIINGAGTIVPIKMDNVTLTQCSEEWMAYVFVHEMAHAAMKASVITWDVNNSEHVAMIQTYLTEMATALTSAYPNLSLYDAYSMCYTGFNNGIDGMAGEAAFLYLMLKEVKNNLNDQTITAQQLIDKGVTYTDVGTNGTRQNCN